jgi:hypothetical protein
MKLYVKKKYNFIKLFLGDNCKMSNKVIKSDKFWYDDPFVIVQSNRLTEFFPTRDQTLEERLNTLVRLALYCSVVLYYHHKNYKYFSIFIGSLLLTYFVYTNNPQNVTRDVDIKEMTNKTQNDQKETKTKSEIKGVEGLENDVETVCTKPTIDNPFMNVTMKDYLNVDPKTQATVDRPPACDTSDENVKKSMDELFNHNLFRDINDVFGKMNSQRQFYTMPSTTIPNAQDEFAKWLYANPKTCKEDQEFCLRYEDVRAKRPVFVDPTKNPESSKKDVN